MVIDTNNMNDICLILVLIYILQIVGAADEVIGSIDTDELAKYFSLKSDPDDEGAEVSI